MNKVVKKSILFGLLALIANPTYPAFGMNIVSNIFTNMFSKVQEHPWLTVGTVGAIAVGIAGYRFCVRRINDLSTENPHVYNSRKAKRLFLQNLEEKKQTTQILEETLKDKSISLTFSQEENNQLDLAFQKAKNINTKTEPVSTAKELDNIIEKIESVLQSKHIRDKLITAFNNIVSELQELEAMWPTDIEKTDDFNKIAEVLTKLDNINISEKESVLIIQIINDLQSGKKVIEKQKLVV